MLLRPGETQVFFNFFENMETAMAASFILAIDQGTTSSRAILVESTISQTKGSSKA
jgi:hypothetical protein